MSSFDTSQVENMSHMFVGCSELRQLNLSSFRTDRVTNMISMFGRCNDIKNWISVALI
ncbi:MAG: BspA family leucine-rich repeat surface protein [Blautia sp.]